MFYQAHNSVTSTPRDRHCAPNTTVVWWLLRHTGLQSRVRHLVCSRWSQVYSNCFSIVTIRHHNHVDCACQISPSQYQYVSMRIPQQSWKLKLEAIPLSPNELDYSSCQHRTQITILWTFSSYLCIQGHKTVALVIYQTPPPSVTLIVPGQD